MLNKNVEEMVRDKCVKAIDLCIEVRNERNSYDKVGIRITKKELRAVDVKRITEQMVTSIENLIKSYGFKDVEFVNGVDTFHGYVTLEDAVLSTRNIPLVDKTSGMFHKSSPIAELLEALDIENINPRVTTQVMFVGKDQTIQPTRYGVEVSGSGRTYEVSDLVLRAKLMRIINNPDVARQELNTYVKAMINSFCTGDLSAEDDINIFYNDNGNVVVAKSDYADYMINLSKCTFHKRVGDDITEIQKKSYSADYYPTIKSYLVLLSTTMFD